MKNYKLIISIAAAGWLPSILLTFLDQTCAEIEDYYLCRESTQSCILNKSDYEKILIGLST